MPDTARRNKVSTALFRKSLSLNIFKKDCLEGCPENAIVLQTFFF